MKTIGIILIVLGIAMFIVPGISFNTKEKVIDAGPIEVNATKENNIAWPSYAGAVSLVAGVVLLVASRKK